MEREIKFRGLSVNGKWHKGLLSISQGKSGQPEKGCYISNESGMPWAYQVRPETVGEYINQKDWRNRELFEGDIVWVEYKEKPFKAVIEFSNQLPGFILRTLEDNKILELNRLAMFCDGEIRLTGVEITGNIHESIPSQ